MSPDMHTTWWNVKIRRLMEMILMVFREQFEEDDQMNTVNQGVITTVQEDEIYTRWRFQDTQHRLDSMSKPCELNLYPRNVTNETRWYRSETTIRNLKC